jgi:hypothetical protein
LQRIVILAVAIAFVTMLAALTALELEHNGVTVLGVIGVCVIVVCGVGIIGALIQPPRR